MFIKKQQFLLRFYLDESHKFNNIPLYEYLILKARELKIAGATAFRGIMGYGKQNHLHTNKIVDLGNQLPVLVEIIDSETKIMELINPLQSELSSYTLTLQPIDLLLSE